MDAFDLDSPGVDKQQQRPARHQVVLRGHAILEDGSRTDVTVLDLSYLGCCIECPVEVRAGEKIKLKVLKRGAIDAEVRWFSGRKAGLAFAPEPVPERVLWPRRSERTGVDVEVSLRRRTHMQFRVRALDLSPHGCGLEFVERPEVDEIVWIKIDGLESLEAAVCWIDKQVAGVKFLRPIHPAVFEMLLSRLR